MPSDQQEVLNILTSELQLIEKGGYRVSAGQGEGTSSTIFVDSPTCLNYGYPYRVHPCGECPLMEFVPEDRRISPMPCHHIPLDLSGQTIEKMEKNGNLAHIQQAVRTWLYDTIAEIESRRSA